MRFHFLDMPTHLPELAAEREAKREQSVMSGHRNSVSPAGLIDAAPDHTQSFDADALDRLDYFICKLKDVGIYSNLNLNVGRKYKKGDDVPDYSLIWVAKAYTYIGERLIFLQKDYAKQLLTHKNPYTGNRYCEEPAIATVEIVNENSMLEFWMRNWLRGELQEGKTNYQLDFTSFYEKQLTDLFNEWLPGHRTQDEIGRLKQEAGVGPNALMPRLRRGDFAIASNLRFHTEAAFMIWIETRFLENMKTYLKSELGVQSLVLGTADHTYWIPSQPMLNANESMDFLDAHVYWQHPAIWGRRNTPMVNDPDDSTIIKLSRSAMQGRPFTVSEVNHPNPNDFASEMIPFLSAYAAFQDWDGIYFYTFEPKVGNEWDPYVFDQFDISLDPVKMVQMKMGALLFLRGDVSAARENFNRSYSHEQVYETMRLPERERPYFTPGFPVTLPLIHGSRIRSLHAQPSAIEAFPTAAMQPPYVSDTGELHWDPKHGENGVFTIDSPKTQALVGFLKQHPVETFHLQPQIANDFCAITLSSLTDLPIRRSNSLLLTACSRWENTEVVWNDRHTLWEDWGHGPTRIEPVTGWLMLRELDGAVGVLLTPLDGAGLPLTDHPIEGRRMEQGWEIPLGLREFPSNQYLLQIIR